MAKNKSAVFTAHSADICELYVPDAARPIWWRNKRMTDVDADGDRVIPIACSTFASSFYAANYRTSENQTRNVAWPGL